MQNIRGSDLPREILCPFYLHEWVQLLYAWLIFHEWESQANVGETMLGIVTLCLVWLYDPSLT
jgi:hypothetical protein